MHEGEAIWAAVVRSGDEAELARRAGAGAFDCGFATPSLVAAVAAASAGRPVIAHAQVLDGAAALAQAGATRLLAPTEALDGAGTRAGGSPEIYALLTPEEAEDTRLWSRLAAAGVCGVAPTAQDGSPLQLWGAAGLDAFARLARGAGLDLGFVGAIEAPDAPRLLALRPRWIAFDAALRDDSGRLSPELMSEIAALTAADAAPPRTLKRLDRIFVRDLTLDAAIGVYAREHGRTQPMRFTVEVDLIPLDHAQAAFAEVFSYDVIVDRIRALAAQGHHELVETMAEEVAAAALAHPRALRARVVAEKLAVIEGSVGVEIVREKPDA